MKKIDQPVGQPKKIRSFSGPKQFSQRDFIKPLIQHNLHNKNWCCLLTFRIFMNLYQFSCTKYIKLWWRTIFFQWILLISWIKSYSVRTYWCYNQPAYSYFTMLTLFLLDFHFNSYILTQWIHESSVSKSNKVMRNAWIAWIL